MLGWEGDAGERRRDEAATGCPSNCNNHGECRWKVVRALDGRVTAGVPYGESNRSIWWHPEQDAQQACERLLRQGSSQVGVATVFVSWWLGCKMETLLDAIGLPRERPQVLMRPPRPPLATRANRAPSPH